MRVALHTDGRAIRGNEQQLLLLVRGLRARGHEVAASAVAGSQTFHALAEAGAEVTVVRPRGDGDVVSFLRFVHWLRQSRADALLATSWKRAVTVLLAGRAAGVPRRVFRLGGPHAHRGQISDRLRAHALAAWATAAYVNSDELRTQLLAYAPALDPARVAIIPNAVEIVNADAAPIRAEVGASPTDRLIASAGGLERNKGFDVLVRAFAAVDATDARLVICGSGPELPALTALAETLDVGRRVHFLGHRTDVHSVLRACDVFALTSREDSTPNALLEAMAAALPVVSTAVCGATALLSAREERPPAGWTAPVDDIAAIADALRQALSAPDAPTRGREAQRRVRAEHTPQRTVTAVESLLQGTPHP